MTRDQAIAIAKAAAAERWTDHDYITDPYDARWADWTPHEWVIDAVIAAATSSPAPAPGLYVGLVKRLMALSTRLGIAYEPGVENFGASIEDRLYAICRSTERLLDSLSTASPAVTQRIPDGYKLAPKKPREETLVAARSAYRNATVYDVLDVWNRIWQDLPESNVPVQESEAAIAERLSPAPAVVDGSASIRAAALEEAAKLCDDTQDCGPDNGCCPTYWNEAAERCAAAIRALASKPPVQPMGDSND